MLVRRLGFYGGAVTALLRDAASAAEPPAAGPSREFEPDRSAPLDAASMAAMGGVYQGVTGA